MRTHALKKSSSLTMEAAVRQAVITVPPDSGDKCACNPPVLSWAGWRCDRLSLCGFFFSRCYQWRQSSVDDAPQHTTLT